ncbi:ATP-dependent nuclease [Flavobacterium sp. RHBU_3]|uniref:ATP-dependent nuclease n=1 Tax=Flavobacterium sp. RHBU_3 TaxID=3391184 RepID=UPI0039849DA4
MKITRIKIENFRSIEKSEFSTKDFNIFVGQNNCGKTNFFEAVQFFFNGVSRGGSLDQLRFKRDPQKEILVELEFSGALNGADKMRNEANKTKILAALDGNDIVVVQRSSTNVAKRKVFVNGNPVNPGTGFDAAFNDFLPKFEYIHTKQYYDSVSKWSKTTPIGIMLSGVLNAILEEDPKYKEFQEKFRELFEDENSEIRAKFEAMGDTVKVHLEKQFPDTSKVKFEVTAPAFDDLLKSFETSIDDGVETSAEEKGDGMQRALMLAIIQAYADFRKKNDDIGKSFLFFIDEAELHLHPSAQRNLKEVLYELSQDTDQVFINTHSSVFVADDFPNQTICKVQKYEGATEIIVTTPIDKPYVVFELLGGSPADLLLPRNFLIVEGLSEFELLTRVIKRFYSEKPQIQIIQANGDLDQAERTINAIEKSFTPLNSSIYKDRLILLLDQPHPDKLGGVNDFRKRFRSLDANRQLFLLGLRDIEQHYPNQVCQTYGNWKKSQDDCDAMNGKKKRQLAKYVGDNISKEQFEADLVLCYEALERCWELAYQN